jgi:flagellar export protein FliJ
MKQFKFRLASVLRIRHIQEDLARARLLHANVAAREAERVVDARHTRYLDLARPAGLQHAPDFARTLFALDSAAGAIDVARDQQVEALAHVAERRAEWSEASMRVDALERLEERHRAEHNIEVRRDEDRVTDDLIVSRYAREDRSA